MATITEKEFDNLARFILETAGIQLEKGKEYLMEARLEPILERYGLDSFSDLHRKALVDQTGKLRTAIIEGITINETYFFRDHTPFDLLKNKIVPDLIDLKSGQSNPTLKIWSAACSTGQEVYSIGMTLKDMMPAGFPVDINILGTDISGEAVARASYGKYNQFEIERGLDNYHLNKYFTKADKGWRIKDEIRSMARFSHADLNKPLTSLGSFDVIFCRNVAIYFPVSGKISLFQRLASVLNPGGVLIVGGSESLAGLAKDFIPRHYLNGVYYQLRKSTSPGAVSDKPVTPPKPLPRRPVSRAPEPTPQPRPIQKSPTRTKPVAIGRKLDKIKVEKTETPPPKPAVYPQPVPKPEQAPSSEHVKSSLLSSLGQKKSKHSSLLAEGQVQSTGKVSLLAKLKEKERKR